MKIMLTPAIAGAMLLLAGAASAMDESMQRYA